MPILVLCYNVTLATKIKQMLIDKGVDKHVTVRNFHGWCSDIIRKFDIQKPTSKNNEYYEDIVQLVINKVEQGVIPTGMYGAVLLDEGHDFQPSWLKLIAMIVNQSNSLLIMYADAQNLYNKKPRFTFKSVGIKAQGRTTILSTNYRNTAEILTLAYKFSSDFIVSAQKQEEDTPVLIPPKSAGRHGSVPEFMFLARFVDEVEYLVQKAKVLHEQSIPWEQIAIVYRMKFMAELIYDYFQKAQIPIEWVNKNNQSRNYKPEKQAIKLVTMHSSKGLEFLSVFIPGIGYMPHKNENPEEEAKLLYISMTRAIDNLLITSHRDSEFSKRIQKLTSSVNIT